MQDEYAFHRNEVIKRLSQYVKGDLSKSETDKFNFHLKQAEKLGREIDRGYKSDKPHSSYYDLMNK